MSLKDSVVSAIEDTRQYNDNIAVTHPLSRLLQCPFRSGIRRLARTIGWLVTGLVPGHESTTWIKRIITVDLSSAESATEGKPFVSCLRLVVTSDRTAKTGTVSFRPCDVITALFRSTLVGYPSHIGNRNMWTATAFCPNGFCPLVACLEKSLTLCKAQQILEASYHKCWLKCRESRAIRRKKPPS